MAKPVVVVTGISGNLGSRLLPLLRSFSVIGVAVAPPQTDSELQFESLDLGAESSTRTFYELLRDARPFAVIHLAFVIDPVRTGVLDDEVGTGHVDREGERPFVVRDVAGSVGREENAGRNYNGIESAVSDRDLVEHGAHAGAVGDVAREADGWTAI